MSEGADKDQKTEQATEKRQTDLREEGKVAQSHDVVSAAALIGACAAMATSVNAMADELSAFAVRMFRLSDAHDPFSAIRAGVATLTGMLPALLAAMIAAIIAGVAQTRGLFQLDAVLPKLERLDPFSRLMNLLPGKQMATELGKSLLKIAAVGIVMYAVISSALPNLLVLGAVDARASAALVGGVAGQALIWAAASFALISALDYGLALHKYNEDAKQTKQEQKEEHKQEEGNPQVKRKMRQRGRELIAQAAATDLKSASVLVTNPTHFAVALRYDPERDAVPMLVGKATEEAALRMRTEARGYRIPIIENRPLARALHKHGKLGKPIPPDMYRAVAEIIAHVMRLKAGVR
ncbi:MAG: flagellar biosynthesis protein FlhB [Myxococcaceae bacterium]|nr:flagellar biosynthesis protein FlhB [Myxococcaceae bacterium]